MCMREPAVAMRVGVRLARRILRSMPMLMMLIVTVWMGVRRRIVDVLMRMAFAHMQPDTDGHQAAG